MSDDAPKSKPERSIGGIWFSQKRQGMLSITVEIDGQKHSFVAFKNDYKAGNQPDFRIFKPRSESPKDSTSESATKPADGAAGLTDNMPF